MLDTIRPNLPVLVLRCRPFGVPMRLVLLLPVEARSLIGAVWRWPGGGVSDAAIGRA